VEPENNKVWLQSQHGRKEKSISLLESNENREKNKICKAIKLLMFQIKVKIV